MTNEKKLEFILEFINYKYQGKTSNIENIQDLYDELEEDYKNFINSDFVEITDFFEEQTKIEF